MELSQLRKEGQESLKQQGLKQAGMEKIFRIRITLKAIDNFVATGDFCETAVGCPTCPPAPQYLRFVSCCDNTTIYLRPDDNSTYLPGVYEYLGTPTVGLENICYSVTLYSVGVAPINNIGDYGGLFEAPAFIENVTFSTLSNTNTES
jgi:hypothetical protein